MYNVAGIVQVLISKLKKFESLKEKLAFVFGSANMSSFTQAVCIISTSFSDCFQVQWIHEDSTSEHHDK